jgi:hypothetical protein
MKIDMCLFDVFERQNVKHVCAWWKLLHNRKFNKDSNRIGALKENSYKVFESNFPLCGLKTEHLSVYSCNLPDYKLY